MTIPDDFMALRKELDQTMNLAAHHLVSVREAEATLMVVTAEREQTQRELDRSRDLVNEFSVTIVDLRETVSIAEDMIATLTAERDALKARLDKFEADEKFKAAWAIATRS